MLTWQDLGPNALVSISATHEAKSRGPLFKIEYPAMNHFSLQHNLSSIERSLGNPTYVPATFANHSVNN